jgi:hypothetical protein
MPITPTNAHSRSDQAALPPTSTEHSPPDSGPPQAPMPSWQHCVPQPHGLQIAHLRTVKMGRIVNDAIRKIVTWDHNKCHDMAVNKSRLQIDHIILAAIADALYKSHGNDIEKAEYLLSDDDLRELYERTLDALSRPEWPEWAGVSAVLRSGVQQFQPKARETLLILRRDFAAIPQLNEVAEKHRWRLLVDPVRIEMLCAQGIDNNNPMLAFIFDTQKNYAYNMANGWIAALSDLEKPWGRELMWSIYAACSGHPVKTDELGGSGKKFAALCDSDGESRILNTMLRLYAQGVHSVVTFPRGTFTIQNGLVKELVGYEKDFPPVTAPEDALKYLFRFYRLGTSGSVVMDAVSEIVSVANDTQGKSDNEILKIASDVYLDNEFLHSNPDANYRASLLAANRILARAGKGLSVPDDPNVSDGAGDTERIQILKQGQDWVKSLCHPAPG